MTMSVSTLIIFKGAATPSKVVNLSISIHPCGKRSRGRAVQSFDCLYLRA
jgi:hypothetical protein